MNILSYPNE